MLGSPAQTRRVPAVRLAALAVAAVLGTGCDRDAPPPMPPAQVYDEPPDFGGEWAGAVEDVEGTLRIAPLGRGQYRGVYRGDSMPVEYILKLEQTMDVEAKGSAPRPTNRITFTWQDGHGGRGTGWLLIDRNSTAMTGVFGEGAGHIGGQWTFRRVTPVAAASTAT